MRKSSLTFAVEAASTLLRERINKKVYEEELLEIVDYVFSHGWRVIKLYFMIGLPGSREVDEAESIIELLNRIHTRGKKKRDINVTVSPFIPKPHTPFEREEQRDREYYEDVVLRVKRGLPRSVKIKNHDLDLSLLEGIVARGDARLGAAILSAYRRGCRLDSWREYFDAAAWYAALDETLPWWRELSGERREEKLPWEWVVTGYEKLKNSWRSRCAELGDFTGAKWRYRHDLDRPEIEKGLERFKKRYEVRALYRLKLSKTGPSRYLSHLDFLEVLRRALRMAGMPVAFTQGFNKHERIAAGFPVPLGIQSDSEIFDIELFELPSDENIKRLRESFPEGIDFIEGGISYEKGSLMGKVTAISYRIEGKKEVISKLAAAVREAPSFTKKTKKGEKEIPFDDAVASWRQKSEEELQFEMKTDSSGTLRIDVAMEQLAARAGVSVDTLAMRKLGQFVDTGKGERELL